MTIFFSSSARAIVTLFPPRAQQNQNLWFSHGDRREMEYRYPLRNLKVEGSKLSCTIHAPIELSNALRRALISKTESYAPETIDVMENTTCQTNEYIAHRIGMIPFCQAKIDENSVFTLNVTGRDCTTKDIRDESGGMVACKNITIMRMIEDQALHIKVKFKKSNGAEHSRFCPVAACTHVELPDGSVKLSFECINDVSPVYVMKDALSSIRADLVKLQESCA